MFAEAETERRMKYRPPGKIEAFDVMKEIEGVRSVSSEEQKRFDFLGDESLVYAAGDRSLLQQRSVAVIGTRNVSENGKKRAWKLAKELAEAGIVVVSGLAKGVDFNAHAACIRAGGRTISVIGTPLDRAYPAAHKRLQMEIYSDHLLISPFEVGTRTYPHHFPKRNQVMALISDATVVVEAGETSGTIHQAKECMRLGRHLFFMKSMVDKTKWAQSFLDSYERAYVLSSTEGLISIVG